jgi:Zn-dependent protease with chaperone function
MDLRLRMSAILAALVALNALFVFALLWGALVALPTAVALVITREGGVVADFLRLPVSTPVYVGLVAVFLLGQLVYGYRGVLGGTRNGTGREESELSDLVTRLAMSVDVSPPGVRVVDDETPSCYTVGRFTDATIIVTTGLLAELDAEEQQAVFAHELAHVANRDVTLMTVTTLFLEITDRVYHAIRLPRRALADYDSLSATEQFAVQYLSVLVVLAYVLLWPVLWLFPVVARVATRSLSHAREFAADAAAAHTTGQPLALATALITLDEETPQPDTDLRVDRMHALCVVPTALVTGRARTNTDHGGLSTEEKAAGAREQRVRTWLDGTTPAQTTASATHPPTETRVDRLQTIAGEL